MNRLLLLLLLLPLTAIVAVQSTLLRGSDNSVKRNVGAERERTKKVQKDLRRLAEETFEPEEEETWEPEEEETFEPEEEETLEPEEEETFEPEETLVPEEEGTGAPDEGGESTVPPAGAESTDPPADVEEEALLLMSMMPFTDVRTDPIINPTTLSNHVHTFYGPPVARPETTFEDLRNAPSGTSNVEQNQSLYWHPTLYRIIDGVYHTVPMAFASVYYLWLPSVTTAFPEGFKMLAFAADGINPNCDPEVYGTPGDGEECLPANINTVFPTTTPNNQPIKELERMLVFPSCWNGNDIESNDYSTPGVMSHVKFPTTFKLDPDPSSCPAGFTTKLPIVRLVIRVLDYQPGNYVFADGTQRLHGDFFSGWVKSELQTIIDSCVGLDYMTGNWCESVIQWKDGNPKTDPANFAEETATAQQFLPSPPFDPTTITTEVITGITSLVRSGNGQDTPLPAA